MKATVAQVRRKVAAMRAAADVRTNNDGETFLVTEYGDFYEDEADITLPAFVRKWFTCADLVAEGIV